jgi:outer membrane murein-binding lipoprotein Lpp
LTKKLEKLLHQIKEEEAKIATLSGKIEDAAPEVSVAT